MLSSTLGESPAICGDRVDGFRRPLVLAQRRWVKEFRGGRGGKKSERLNEIATLKALEELSLP